MSKKKKTVFQITKASQRKRRGEESVQKEKASKKKEKDGLKKINRRTEWKGRWFHMIVQPQHELEEDSCDLE